MMRVPPQNLNLHISDPRQNEFKIYVRMRFLELCGDMRGRVNPIFYWSLPTNRNPLSDQVSENVSVDGNVVLSNSILMCPRRSPQIIGSNGEFYRSSREMTRL